MPISRCWMGGGREARQHLQGPPAATISRGALKLEVRAQRKVTHRCGGTIPSTILAGPRAQDDQASACS